MNNEQILHDVEAVQRTAAWFNARLGKVTASGVYNILVTKRNGAKTKRYATYKRQIIIERLTGETVRTTNFNLPQIQWGLENEHHAIQEYVDTQGVTVTSPGFIPHPTIEMAGASPDGLVRDDGLLEVKCPTPGTHLKFLTDGEIHARYMAQMQFQMVCAEREWCDFVSYDPRFQRAGTHFKIQRVYRDDDAIAKINSEVVKFLEDVEKTIDTLQYENMVM